MAAGQFLLGLLAFSFGLSAAVDYPCPAQRGAYALCSTTVLYIIDTSSDLTSPEISAEFDWIRYNILPGTAWSTNQKLALLSYGTGNLNSYQPTGELSTACIQLNSLQEASTTVPNSAPNLLNVMKTVNLYYGNSSTTMILFSASKDSTDIAQTANYVAANMASKQFTVIAMNGANFNGFPGTIYSISNLADVPPNLGACIIKRACDQSQYCDINGQPETTIAYTTVSAAPVATTPSPLRPAVQCQCNTMKVWVDMIFVIDASSSTGASGLNEMWDIAGTMLDLFNVQKTGYTGSNYYSQVGIITYGNSATVLYPLGTLDNDDIDNLFELPFNNDKNTNLEAGLQAAVTQFNGPNHRGNARRVIFVMAAAYDPDGVNSPNKTAQTFQENNGVLMVYNYVPVGGIESSALKVLASPGYFFSTKLNSSRSDTAAALCDANCFCGPLYSFLSQAVRGYPTEGCSIAVTAQINQARAKNLCTTQYNNATLAYDQSAAKNNFLIGIFPQSMQFFIGLTYDSLDRLWEWPDGSLLGSYQPWYNGIVPSGTDGNQCVYVEPSSQQWYPTSCRNPYALVCETIPCDSLNYCP